MHLLRGQLSSPVNCLGGRCPHMPFFIGGGGGGGGDVGGGGGGGRKCPAPSKCMPPPIRRMDGRLQYNIVAQQDNTQQIHNVFLHAICVYICSDLLPAHPASFAQKFVSGMPSFYFSESQDAIVLQTCH